MVLTGLWPQPALVLAAGSGICLSPSSFRVDLVQGLSPRAAERLQRAFKRLKGHIFNSPSRAHTHLQVEGGVEWLAQLSVRVASSDLRLTVRTNESYELTVNLSGAQLLAPTVYGALHGLETFSQLTSPLANCGVGINASTVFIQDAPRFRWRGLMLDTARHFLPVPTLTGMLDAMSYNKLNVLHWHISDSQSFPLATRKTKALARGAFAPHLVYTTSDVQAVIAFAADRGIRVVPELDSPGHATSWSLGYPNATLPQCHTTDPTANATFALLADLVSEVSALFPDEFFHIGGDEVDFNCWNNSERVVAYMSRHNLPRNNTGFKELTVQYIGRVASLLGEQGKTVIAWQEAMDHYGPTAANPTPPSPQLPANAVIEQWLEPEWNWANLSAITGEGYLGRPDARWPAGFQGFEALVTLGWYLDAVADLNSWEAVYVREPLTNQSCTYDSHHREVSCECKCPSGPWRDDKCHCYDLRGKADAAAKVLGGEAPIWGEHIDASNLESRAWPRASAVAERLWSAMELNNATAATPRMLKHRCRMLERGVRVTPLGPGFC